MANPTPSSPQPIKRRSWTRKLLIVAGAFFVLLVVAYFVATSAAFLKGVILPRVSKAMNAEITVGDASISPFSQVVLRQLKVQTTGTEPLLQANEVRLRYSLWSIIGGNIKVDEITLDSPTIRIVQNADGSSNLDPFLQKGTKPAEKPKPTPSKPLQLDVRNVALKNVSVRAVQNLKDGGRQTFELSEVNIGLDQLKIAAAGKLTLAAVMKLDRTLTNAHDSLQARGSGALEFALGPDLMPQFVRGKVTHEIVKGDGAFSGVAGERTELNCDVTPTEVKEFSVSFFQADKPLGALRVTGPFDLNKLEGRLSLEVRSIDRQVLNLAGAPRGWDFGGSTLNATNLIDISQNASVIAANGKLVGRQLGIRQGAQATPQIDLDFDYQVTVNLKEQTALVQKLGLAAQQGQNELLRLSLDKPMNLSWGQGQPGFKESSLQLAVKLNLADWQLFLGNLPVSGKVDTQFKLLAQQDGKQMKADITAKIQELTAQFGSNKVDRANVQLQLAGQLADFKNVTVEKYSFAFGQANQSLLSANGSASYALTTGDLSAQTTIEGSLPGLLKIVALPQVSVSSGTIKMTALALRKGQETSASGNFVLGDFSGGYGDYQLQNYQTTFDFDVGMKDKVAQLRRVTLALRQGSESGGSFDVTGKYDTAKNSGEFAFKAVDFNQNALRPFLAPSLAPNKLVSLALNAKGNASYDANGESSVKMELKLANFIVDDPQHKLPKTPLSAGFQLDAGLKQKLATLRQLVVSFSPNDSAKSEFQVAGQFDLDKKAGAMTFSATDWNESAFLPFLGSALAPNRLVSVSLNAKGSANYDAQGQSSVKCDLNVTNLVVEAPEQKLPKTPQSVGLHLDGSMQKELLDLRQLVLKFAPTDRAKNELQLSGKINLAKISSAPGQMSLQADSLDLTPLYDIFAGQTGSTNQTSKPAVASAPATAGPRTEPDPIALPVQQFTFDGKIDRLYLRDIAISNFVMTAKITTNEVAVKPFQLTFNGAPVNASALLNLGVKGYTYDVSLSADKIPLDPIVNSFMPDSRGQYRGLILANAQIKGAGITDANLQKNLTGQLGVSFTNATIQLFANNKPPKNVFTRLIWYTLEGIGVFLRVNEISSSPLNAIQAQAQIGDGKINLTRLSLQSQAFEAHTQGIVPMQVPLTNSPLNLPLEFSLSRSLAQKSGLMPANTPPNAAYAALPTFVTVKGTVGDPKRDFNELALGGLLLKGGVGIAEKLGVNVGDKTGSVLKGVGNLLTGPGGANSGVANTNIAATNPPPAKFNPFDLLPKKKK